jgi:hypothetical protein
VESYRTGRGSRQRVVAYLGDLKRSEKSGWAQLGRQLDSRQRPQPTLFDAPRGEDPTEDEPVLVKLKGVRLERLPPSETPRSQTVPRRAVAKMEWKI